MTPAPMTRRAQKEQTRRRLLDAALELLVDDNLASLSVREVTRIAGVSPNAFYRHFPSLAELGLVLVDESFGTLRDLTSAVRQNVRPELGTIRPTVEVVAAHVAAHPAHFTFILRERSGGMAVVRQAIRREIRMFVLEVATHLSRLPGLEEWDAEDVRLLADLLVLTVVHMVEGLLEVPPDRPDLEAAVRAQGVRQMGMLAQLGRLGRLESAAPSLRVPADLIDPRPTVVQHQGSTSLGV